MRGMARGFDSKFIEAQQEEATRTHKMNPAMTPEQQQVRLRRESLVLARNSAVSQLERATAAAHRRMLEQAIAALDEQLESLR
jgi:hypothetical protein